MIMHHRAAMYSRVVAFAGTLAVLNPSGASAQQSHLDMLANAPMFENRPTAEAAAELKDELLFQRGTQACLWALPLINTLGMKLGSERVFGAGYNVLPIWKNRRRCPGRC
jgi:hypothetical protein